MGPLVEQSDVVIHLAGAVGVRYILEHPLATIKTNVEGTGIVLGACARSKRKVLVASTSEVYGKNSAQSLCETADSILGPSSLSRWSYATSKKLDEFLALAYAARMACPWSSLASSTSWDRAKPAATAWYCRNFIQAALERKRIRVFGDGLQSRNFTFIGDCLDAVLLLLFSKQAEGEIVNIGSPHEISILELAERARSIAGSSATSAVFCLGRRRLL